MRDNLQWLQRLAHDEVTMEEKGFVDYTGDLSHEFMIEESTLSLLNDLKSKFENYIDIFNAVRNNNTGLNLIKIYRISNTSADFMIFRNGVKLVVSNSETGVVNISFANHTRNAMYFSAGATSDHRPTSPFARSGDSLIAQIGPFGDVAWLYKGEKINLDQIARFYLTEFIKQSVR